MRIIIETIPHQSQRYDTVGDWWLDADGTFQIRVSEELRAEAGMQGERAVFLVAFHELIEMVLCFQHGVKQSAVDEFDLKWKPRLIKSGDTPYEDQYSDEPGDDPTAPYYVEHQIACGFERMIAAQLDVDWNEYERSFEKLPTWGK